MTVKTVTTGMNISSSRFQPYDKISNPYESQRNIDIGNTTQRDLTPKMSAILINNNEFLTARSTKPQESNRLVFDFDGLTDREKGTSNKHRLVRKIRENEDFSDTEEENENSSSKINNFFGNGNDSVNESFGSFNDNNQNINEIIENDTFKDTLNKGSK